MIEADHTGDVNHSSNSVDKEIMRSLFKWLCDAGPENIDESNVLVPIHVSHTTY